MDFITPLILSVFLGYFVSKIDKIEAKMDQIENEVIQNRLLLPKRKDDEYNL